MCHRIMVLLCICAFCCTHETSLIFQVDLASHEKNLNYTYLSKMDQLPTDQQELVSGSVYNYDADLEVSDTCVRSSLLS